MTARERQRTRTLADWERRLDRAILDLRIILSGKGVPDDRRPALWNELLAYRCARVGVHTRNERDYLQRLGITGGRRAPTMRHGPWPNSPPLRIR